MVLQTNSPKEAKEMLTKTRTTLIALVASASFATAAVVPAVSQARAKVISAGTKAAQCEVLRHSAELSHKAAEAAEGKGESDWARYYYDQEEKAQGEAGNLGCLWEIEIDVAKSATKVKAIKVPAATVPATGKTTTSTSTSVAVAVASTK
jgi:hypothetical protein